MNKDCTVYKTMDLLGKKWTLLVILELYKGNKKWKRYSEIKRKMEEITPKVLSSRLKELQDNKLIENRVDAEQVPIKSEYCLTESGEDLINVIKSLKDWALEWKFENEICKNAECKECEF